MAMQRLRPDQVRNIDLIADEAIYHLSKLQDNDPENEWLTQKGVRLITDHVGKKLAEIEAQAQAE